MIAVNREAGLDHRRPADRLHHRAVSGAERRPDPTVEESVHERPGAGGVRGGLLQLVYFEQTGACYQLKGISSLAHGLNRTLPRRWRRHWRLL